jgi:hypothetical protein
VAFRDSVESIVQGILADQTQWPEEMSYAIPQLVAQSPIAAPSTGIIAFGTRTSNVTTTGTTFAGGADILSSPLSFTASGKDSYLLTVIGRDWQNNTASTRNILRLNLDGADAGIFADDSVTAANFPNILNAQGVINIPSVGSHTINARFQVTGGTGTIEAGSGGAGVSTPILVTVQRIAVGN